MLAGCDAAGCKAKFVTTCNRRTPPPSGSAPTLHPIAGTVVCWASWRLRARALSSKSRIPMATTTFKGPKASLRRRFISSSVIQCLYASHRTREKSCFASQVTIGNTTFNGCVIFSQGCHLRLWRNQSPPRPAPKTLARALW